MNFLNMLQFESQGKSEAMSAMKLDSAKADHATRMHLTKLEMEYKNSGAVNAEKSRTEQEKKRANSLEAHVQFYEGLLAKPMWEIAKYNDDFKKTFTIQQQNLNDWMVSQKAYKELTYDLAFSFGLSEVETDKHYLGKVDQILDNTHPTEKVVKGFEQYGEQTRYNLHQAIKNKFNSIETPVSISNETTLKLKP